MVKKKFFDRRADGVAFFDLDGPLRDGTLLEWYSFLRNKEIISSADWILMEKEIAAFFKKKRKSVAQSAIDAMNIYARALEGRTVSEIKLLAREFVNAPGFAKIRSYALELVSLMRANKCKTNLITGQPVELAEAFAGKLGIDAAIGTVLETDRGKYTGKVLVNNSVGMNKEKALRELVGKYSKLMAKAFTFKSFAFGDTLHDMPMLERVTHPIALNPNEDLARWALSSGWHVCGPENVLETVSKKIVESDRAKHEIPPAVRRKVYRREERKTRKKPVKKPPRRPR